MPKIKVIFFADKNGDSQVLQWLERLPNKIQAKGHALIKHLGEKGHELRRPIADYIQEGIYELRWAWQGVNYRILYFFHEREAVVITYGLTKKDKVPQSVINKAIKQKQVFESNRAKYSLQYI